MINRLADLLRFGWVAIACATVFVGCVTSRPTSLESAINSLYRSEKSRDGKTMSSLAHPYFIERSALEGFIKGIQERTFDIISWRILSISEEPVADYTKVGLKAEKAVKVLMDVTVYDREDETTRKEEDQTDYWILQGDRWIWCHRGWPSD